MVEEIPPKLPLVICLDGVVGEQVSRYKEGTKTIIVTRIAPGIVEDKISSGLLKINELIDGDKFPIKTDKYTDILDTPSNPMVLIWTDFHGDDVDFTPKTERLIAMERKENHILNLQVMDLQRKLQLATSDIARFIKENRETFKPLIEEIKEIRPTVVTPRTTIRRTKPG